MKIFYLAGVDTSNFRSGMAVHVVETAHAMAQMENQVCLYAPQSEACIMSSQAFQSVSVPTVKRGDRLKLARRFLHDLKSQRPDIVYFRCNTSLIPAILRARRLGIPYVIELNGIGRYQSTSWRRHFAEWLTGRACRKALCCITVTPEIRDFVVRAYHVPKERVHCVRSGVNPETYKPYSSQEALTPPEKGPTIGYMGGLSTRAGLEIAVETMAIVRKQIPHVRLLLAGEGNLGPQLREQVRLLGLEEQVLFVGAIPYADSARFVAGCDVMLVPFRDDRINRLVGASPMKFFCYLACAKPIVTSDLPFLKWFQESGAVAFARSNDAQSLAEAICKILGWSPEERQAMGQKGRQFALKGYTWQVLAARKLGIIQERLAAPRYPGATKRFPSYVGTDEPEDLARMKNRWYGISHGRYVLSAFPAVR